MSEIRYEKDYEEAYKRDIENSRYIFRLIDCFNSDSNNSCYKFCVYSFQVNSGSLETANQALNAKLEMKSVELTFFSTFPRFGLKLVDGSLVSKVFSDTAWQKTDSLLSFGKCVVVVNPIDYLINKKITLNYLGLEDASVYL